MVKKKKQLQAVQLTNKKATFSYHIDDTYTAGIVLKGTEIKSLRLGKGNLKDGFCYFAGGELWVKGLHISEYMPGSYNNHVPEAPRKLLLHKSELQKLFRKKQEKGFTIIPLRLFTNAKNMVKVAIGLGKGKKLYDKRATIKARELQRKVTSRDL